MQVTSAKPDRSLSQVFVLECLAWAVLVAVSWWWTISSTEQEQGPVIAFMSVLSLVSGTRVFLGHGGPRISATGLFGLSAAMFVGLSGLLLLDAGDPPAGWRNLALAVAAALTAQVASSMLAWRPPTGGGPYWIGRRLYTWFTRAGLIALALATAVHLAAPALAPITAAAAFAATTLLSAGFFLREDKRFLILYLGLVAGAVILYIELFHGGEGRLHIVAMACAIAIIVSARFPYRSLKTGIVAAVPAAIIWMALDRLALEEDLGADPNDGRTGLESMNAPLQVLSQLIEGLRGQDFHLSLGYNLLSIPAIFIPNFLWPDEPTALGYELVQFAAPELYGDGIFSTVATFVGEMMFNFGWFGILVVIIFAVLLLRTLDSLLGRHLDRRRGTRVAILGFVLLAMLAGALADYTWSGVHTYVARTLYRLPVIFVVWIFAVLADQWQRRRTQM